MWVCYNNKCEKTSCSYAARFFQKINFLGPVQGQEKSKIREIVSFWEVTETSAGPNFTIPSDILRIFSSSKSFKTVLSFRSSQKKSLSVLRAASTKFFDFPQKFSCGCRNFWVPWYPKNVFFERAMGQSLKPQGLFEDQPPPTQLF